MLWRYEVHLNGSLGVWDVVRGVRASSDGRIVQEEKG